tara:strand:+ start:709 stop:1242 length:534 start_codon:yes stop_codon:yes gene_type:complete
MAHRILIGNRATGGYGMYVSKSGADVLTCAPKDLLFDSRQGVGSGLVYAGGQLSSLTASVGKNFLTTGSKQGLGYIPLVITNEAITGTWGESGGGGLSSEAWDQNRVDVFATTASHIYPMQYDAGTGGSHARRTSDTPSPPVGYSRGGSQGCVDLLFIVLKMPCAYGYMNSTYFEEY